MSTTSEVTSTTETIPAASRPHDSHERIEEAVAEVVREPLNGNSEMLPRVLLQPHETIDQAFLRLARERLQQAADRIDATLEADRDGAGWGNLSVAASEMRAALGWLAGIGTHGSDNTNSVTQERR
jgi:hypothetical protein